MYMYMYMYNICMYIYCGFQANVKKVLNDMGKNVSDFFTELMEAFHQVSLLQYLHVEL